MKIEDRLNKAERKLDEHIQVCKQCQNNLYDITFPCSIAHQLDQAINEIKKQMRNTKFKTGRSW